jgi:hypothetical protein
LNATLFRSLHQARLAIDDWRADYSTLRRHPKLGELTPAGYAARSVENEELEGRPSGRWMTTGFQFQLDDKRSSGQSLTGLLAPFGASAISRRPSRHSGAYFVLKLM